MPDHEGPRQLIGCLVDALRDGTPPPAGVVDAVPDLIGVAQRLAPPAWPGNLVGRACDRAPAVWVAETLVQALAHDAGKAAADEAPRTRVLYLARLLGRYLGAGEPRHLPGVSIVITVYNNADMVGDALDSCLAQTHGRTEIVVVDDGSTDDIDTALAPYLGRIALVRQANRGVSHARRAGIEAAGGDLVHFLDADDLLLPDCIAAKADAFAAAPDASLCYGGIIAYDPDVVRMTFAGYDNPGGGPLCPTRNFPHMVGRSLPFLPSTVMMPKWLLLEMNAFHEGLRQSDDIRLWFQLGLRRPKILGLIGKTTLRHYRAGSHGRILGEPSNSRSTALLLNYCDLIADQSLWHNAFHYLSAQCLAHLWQEVNAGDAPQLIAVRDRLLGMVSALGDGASRDGRSPLPLLAMILAALRFLADEEDMDHSAVDFAFHRQLEAAARAAARTAAPLTDADTAFWLQPDYAGVFSAGDAVWLARLLDTWSAETDGAGMVAAIELLRHLANPAFVAEAYPDKTLAELRSKVMHWGRQQTGATRAGPMAAIRALLPGGRDRRAGEMIDRLFGADTVAAGREVREDRAGWRTLSAVAAERPEARAHLENLRAVVTAQDVPSDRRRGQRFAIRWHAKALARSLGSVERRHDPTSAMIIAADGRAEAVAATIEGGLSQSCGAIDLVVVGDDRDGTLSAALAPFSGRVRLVHQVMPDTAAAWNTAIHHCHADFVIFLAPGERPAHTCIARHLDRQDEAPSATVTWDRGAWARTDSEPVSVDLMAAVVDGCLPRFCGWGAPHWLLCRTGPFDTWLEGTAHERYMMRLAMADAAVALVDGAVVDRAAAPSAGPVSRPEQVMVDLLGLADLFDRPHLWSHLATWARRMRSTSNEADMSASESLRLRLVRRRLDEAITRLASRRGGGGALALALEGLEARPHADRLADLEQSLRAASRSGATGVQEASAPSSS